ncbi:MAG: 50S ribosomal protein L3 [Planctomycetes bacterium]|nr:50S ribosomal protein L3 [Planctomycetota bacterium]
MSGLIGRKIGMLNYFTSTGQEISCTAVEVGPCFCVDIRTKEKNGYTSVLIGFEQKKEKRTIKPQLGYFKKRGLYPFKKLNEFQILDEKAQIKIGDKFIAQDIFKEGMFIDATGFTKGRGFAGVVKRWRFEGGPATHGQSDRQRHPGSLGRHGSNSRDVPKGKKMAGHYGDEKVTIQNLQVVKVLQEQNSIIVCGAVPGANGNYVIINRSVKLKDKILPIGEQVKEKQESKSKPVARSASK